MPTRKQRRRRVKGRRHEYEYFYVDDEGHEVELDEPEEKPERGTAKNGGARRDGKSTSRRTGSRAGRAGRAGRTVQPPSWRRIGKRGAIFAPLMFVFVSILYTELTIAQRLMQTLFLLAVFLPFSYVMDSMTYRMWRRRNATPDDGSGSRKA